jgi:hypothetical protein
MSKERTVRLRGPSVKTLSSKAFIIETKRWLSQVVHSKLQSWDIGVIKSEIDGSGCMFRKSCSFSHLGMQPP